MGKTILDGDKLSQAAVRGDWQEVKRLLTDEKVNANAVNKFGQTALQVMMLGSTMVAEELLKNGAQPNVQDRWGFTPAHDVARSGFLDTMKVLIKYKANVNIKDAAWCLPIHMAAQEGYLDLVQYLTPRSSILQKNISGQTPLDLARASNRTEVVAWLEQQLQAMQTQTQH
ncbi:cyclin-dependent kinase 4 inhibitor D-like [Hemiscyllium ocellatum]|uniref:cyclin-dependent kinase 4 inhibitor D-like n=1 Tax=Hemiscyllium ocellatum TaxID=170820 RepID=UPI0029661C1C|nr:cyclin-dependent kinase 4 inhibitor D-like [Hemiscyllium ocellatum]